MKLAEQLALLYKERHLDGSMGPGGGKRGARAADGGNDSGGANGMLGTMQLDTVALRMAAEEQARYAISCGWVGVGGEWRGRPGGAGGNGVLGTMQLDVAALRMAAEEQARCASSSGGEGKKGKG